MQSLDLPKVLALLNLRRPGSMPSWKTKKLQEHMMRARSKLSDEKNGKARKFDFFGVGEERLDGQGNVVKIGWQIEGIPEYNDGKPYFGQGEATKRELELHRAFLKRIVERPMVPHKVMLHQDAETGRVSILASNNARHWTTAWDPNAHPITLSPAEKERMTNMLLKMELLELEIPCFACYGQKEVKGSIQAFEKILQILDYVFKLGRRELWEIAVLANLLFMESALIESSNATRQYANPLFSSSNLRRAVSTVLNEKSRAFQDISRVLDESSSFFEKFQLLLGIEPYYQLHCELTNFDCPSQMWLRGLLWDENQKLVSEFMEGLDSAMRETFELEIALHAESYLVPLDEALLQVLLHSLAQDADADHVKDYVRSLNTEFVESMIRFDEEPVDVWLKERDSQVGNVE